MEVLLSNRVLVVDDEPDIAGLVKVILEKEGYQVVTASGGEEGLQKAETDRPDLILIDVVMPDKNGLEVCKILKSESKTENIPIVVFTVLGGDANRKLAVEAGCDGYLTKPFNAEDLLAKVKKHLRSPSRKIVRSMTG